MALMFKRIMIVTHNVQFAIDAKRSLEQFGGYAVTTMTDTMNALERLRTQPHNLVLLDVENIEIPGIEMVSYIRKVQSEIAIILAPDLPDVREMKEATGVQAVINIPISIRQLIPVLEGAVQDMFESLPDTTQAPAVYAAQETVYIETLVDELLDEDTPYFTSRQVRAQKSNMPELDDDDDNRTVERTSALEFRIESKPEGTKVRFVPPEDTQGDRSLELFRKLAQEEPPMPNLGESGTVRDLAKSASQSEIIIADDDELEETELQENSPSEAQADPIPVMLVLQTALDETTPIEAISLKTLYDNIQDRLPGDKQAIRPLPSWIKEGEKFVREPNFLPDNLPSFDTQRPLEYTSTTTQPSESASVLSNPQDMETEVIDIDTSHMVVSELTLIDGVEDADDIEDVNEQLDDPTSFEEAETEPEEDTEDEEEYSTSPVDAVDEDLVEVEEVAPDDVSVDEEVDEDELESASTQDEIAEDSYVAQLAVTLTQVTTELTAEATILTRDNNIVAYSGDMPIEDIQDLRDVIHNDWSAQRENARIRFITLPSSGKDYMLYSIGTVGNFTLSMVFIGTKQLRVIRRQGQKMINALEAIPEEIDEVEIEVTQDEIDSSPVDALESEDVPAEEMLVDDTADMSEIIENDEALSTLEIPQVKDEDSEPLEPIDVGPKLPYTFIWLLDDPMLELSESVARQLVFWLETQLNSLYWTVYKLEVHADFIYLYADIPGEANPSELIRGLMNRSKKIALSEDETLPEDLWADAYLVLTPGRDMTDREIQRFLNFARF